MNSYLARNDRMWIGIKTSDHPSQFNDIVLDKMLSGSILVYAFRERPGQVRAHDNVQEIVSASSIDRVPAVL